MSGGGHLRMAVAGIVTVTLTGAESTGKTTLAAALADHFGTARVPEYLRLFVDRKRAVPVEQDVNAIAQGHLRSKAELLRKAKRVIFLDTDLVTTCVYQRIYFGHCPKEIVRLARDNSADLHLFTHPDFPWEPDGIQRSSPEARDRTHRLLRQELEQLELPFVNVTGNEEERHAISISAVEALLRSRPIAHSV